MNRAFVDSSAWCALFNRDEPACDTISRCIELFAGRLVTSNYIFDETITFCRARLGHATTAKIGAALKDSAVVHLEWITPADEESAWTLFLDRADKTYSFTDCTSFILMRRLKITQALTLDADFRQEGFTSLPSP